MNQEIPPLSPQALILEGTAHNGKTCRIVDNTGTWSQNALQLLLESLIEQKQFGVSGLSISGGSTVRLGEPQFTHIQHNNTLYTLILFPYEARIQSF